jgi:hypothetical protein
MTTFILFLSFCINCGMHGITSILPLHVIGPISAGIRGL